MKYGLALHTSSPALGLAISNHADNVRCQTWDLGRETSNYLHPYLLDFISPQSWQDLGWIAVAAGPGGFTGTRLALVTARTLGQQLEIPVFTISSLAAIAWQLFHSVSTASSVVIPEGTSLAIAMPAQRGEVFGAVYQLGQHRQELTTILADSVFSAGEWAGELTRLNPVDCHTIPQSANLADTVTGVLDLARIAYDRGERPDWSLALPFYGQHPVINSVIAK